MQTRRQPASSPDITSAPSHSERAAIGVAQPASERKPKTKPHQSKTPTLPEARRMGHPQNQNHEEIEANAMVGVAGIIRTDE
jgi:hypothetical protein